MNDINKTSASSLRCSDKILEKVELPTQLTTFVTSGKETFTITRILQYYRDLYKSKMAAKQILIDLFIT